MQISSFDGSTPVFGASTLKPGDRFVPNADAKVEIKIPFTKKSYVGPWPVLAEFDRIEPRTMQWHEWLPKPTGWMRQFRADITLQQRGTNLDLTMSSKLNGIPMRLHRTYEILSSDSQSLALKDAVTGQTCVTQVTPTGATDAAQAAYNVFFDWTLPLGMRITKHGELFRMTPAAA